MMISTGRDRNRSKLVVRRETIHQLTGASELGQPSTGTLCSSEAHCQSHQPGCVGAGPWRPFA